MLTGYETEQAGLTATTEALRAEIEDLKSKTANLQSFMKLVAKVGEIIELTEEMARMFIEKVVVHEAVYRTGTKRVKESQQVDVHFSYIGQFDIGEEDSGRWSNIQATSRYGGVIVVK